MRQDCHSPNRDLRFHISKNNNNKKKTSVSISKISLLTRYIELRPARVKIIKCIGEKMPNAENFTYMRINADGLYTQRRRKQAASDTAKHRVIVNAPKSILSDAGG